MADYADVFKKLGLLSNGDAPKVDQGMNYNAHPMDHVDVLGSMGTQLRQIANNAYATARSGGGLGELIRAGIKEAGNDPMVNTLRNNAQPQAPQQAQISQAPADYKDWSLGDSRHQFAGSLLGDPLNFIPAAKPSAEGILAGGKWVGKEAARQIEDGTGLLSHIMPDPRQYVYAPRIKNRTNPAAGYTYESSDPHGLVTPEQFRVDDPQHFGKSILNMPWDASSRNRIITSVSGESVTNPYYDGVIDTHSGTNHFRNEQQIITHGGMDYVLDDNHILQQVGGASGRGIAERIADRESNAIKENLAAGGNGKILHMPTTMGDDAESFSIMPSQVFLSIADKGYASKAQIQLLDDEIRNTAKVVGTKENKVTTYPYQGFKGIMSEEGRNQLLTGDGIGTSAGNLRIALANRIKVNKHQEAFGFNYQDLQNAILDPKLMGKEKGQMGHVVMQNSEGGMILTPSKNPSYDTNFSANLVGAQGHTIDIADMMQSPYERIFKEMSSRTGNTRNHTIGALEKRKDGVAQFINDQYLQGLKNKGLLD
jgi:hypothetical protein